MRSNILDLTPGGPASTVGISRRWIVNALAALVLLAPFGCGGPTSPNADAVLAGPDGEPSPFEDDTSASDYEDPMYSQQGRR